MVNGLTTTSSGGLIDVVLDRDEENLLTLQACRELTTILRDPPERAHVLQLRAMGPNFCLGRERAGETIAALRTEVDDLIALNRALRTTPLITVASVQGGAAGYGVGIAALCDLVLASQDATFWFPEIEIDLAPVVVLAWLPSMIGRRAAFELTATGRVIHAAEALRLGLISQIASGSDDLRSAADALVASLLKRQPRVHREIRAFLEDQADLSEAQAYRLARDRLVVGSMARRS